MSLSLLLHVLGLLITMETPIAYLLQEFLLERPAVGNSRISLLLDDLSRSGSALGLLLFLALSLKVLSITIQLKPYKFAGSVLLTDCFSLAT